ncbi:hypothetical protein ES705_45083 [subsurface metagenome]
MESRLDRPPRPPTLFDDNTPNRSCQVNSSLDKDTISEKKGWGVYSHCVIYTPEKNMPYKKKQTRSSRGSVRKFSKKSRFRLFTALAKIRADLPHKPIFVSLTYHYGHRLIIDDNKTHLHHFLVRLRQFDLNVQFVWRIELQKRGAPHFHLIIFPGVQPDGFKEDDYNIKISSLWHEIADPKSRAHKEYGCKVKSINSYREACIYLSKYVAKEPIECDSDLIGKHWGCSRNLPYEVVGTIEANRNTNKEMIEKLRKWLIKNGHREAANPDYFNVDRPQTIFIDSDEFYIVVGFGSCPL